MTDERFSAAMSFYRKAPTSPWRYGCCMHDPMDAGDVSPLLASPRRSVAVRPVLVGAEEPGRDAEGIVLVAGAALIRKSRLSTG